MRPLEILLPLLLVLYFGWPLSNRRRPLFIQLVPVLALGVLMAHVLLEGQRWQMYPLYALTAGALAMSAANYFKPNPATHPRRLLRDIPLLALLVVGAALPLLLPVPGAPAPTGPYTVGTRTEVLVDESRREIYSGRDEPRKFMAQIWYPAHVQPNAQPTPWMKEAALLAPLIAEDFNLPRFFLDHIALARTSSFANAEADGTGGPYPVILFSHGWTGFRTQSTFLMEELASHGYIVVATEHTYGARLTVFPDGQISPSNPAALPSGKPQDEYETAARILVDQWAHDLGYTLDFLAELNRADAQLAGLLNLEKVGVTGHSTGGGAAIQFCGTDARCRAIISLDAFMRPVSLDVLEHGLRQPSAYVFSETWSNARNTELFKRFYSHVDSSARVLTILGTGHYDFSDIPALSPLAPQLGLKGPINGARVQALVRAYVVAFFDATLKGAPTILLDGPSADYPEVRFDH